MKNREQFPQKPEQNTSLIEAYKLVHKKEPKGMSDYEMVRRIIEVIANENFIPADLARKCIQAIKVEIKYPDEKARTKTLLDLDDFLAFPTNKKKEIDEK
jgi:hypothetical protein